MRKRSVRLRVLGLLATAALLGAAGGGASETSAAATTSTAAAEPLEPINFRFATVSTISTNLPLYIARDKGYFEEEALSVEFLSVQNGAAITAALAGGSADVGVTSAAILAGAVADGLAVKLIAASVPVSDLRLMVPPDGDIPVVGQNGATWQDVVTALNGRNIGTAGRGSTPDIFLTEYFREVGLTAEDYVPINAGNGSAVQETLALESGQVDATISGGVTPAIMVESGAAVVALDFSRDGPEHIVNLANRGFDSPTSFIEAHPDFPARFQRALQKAFDYMTDEANYEDVKKTALDNGLLADDEFVDVGVETMLTGIASTFTEEQLESIIVFLERTGTITEDSTLSIDDFAVPEAYGAES